MNAIQTVASTLFLIALCSFHSIANELELPTYPDQPVCTSNAVKLQSSLMNIACLPLQPIDTNRLGNISNRDNPRGDSAKNNVSEKTILSDPTADRKIDNPFEDTDMRFSREPVEAFSPPRLTVGQVLTSPDSQKTCFRSKDLIYIKIKRSAGNIIQVGDRYGIESENNGGINSVCSDRSLIAAPSIAGEVEIICVGEDTALGVILKSHSSISRGGNICRLDSRASGSSNSRKSASNSSNQISSF